MKCLMPVLKLVVVCAALVVLASVFGAKVARADYGVELDQYAGLVLVGGLAAFIARRFE